MIITKIKQIAKTNRYHLYADETWRGIFLAETLARYQLKTGQEIEDERFREIKEENDEKLAFDLAASYMEKYVVSEKGIKDYLKKKNFDYKTIKVTIEKLKEYEMVDDEKFAKNYFDALSSSRGKKAIAVKLKQKGVSDEIVQNLLENVDENVELEKAVGLANKFVKNRQNDTKLTQKCLAHLIYKGYDYGVAQQATKIALKGDFENDWI